MAHGTITPVEGGRGPAPRLSLLCGLMLLGAIGLFLLIQAHGEATFAPPVPAAPRAAPAHGATLARVLAALAAVIALGRLLGWLLARLGQPPVIGEVVAGILLGPSFFGAVAPEAQRDLFPPTSPPTWASSRSSASSCTCSSSARRGRARNASGSPGWGVALTRSGSYQYRQTSARRPA